MSEKKPDILSNGSESEQDLDFDPTADMMVNDFDDEHTLEEEEALEGDNSNELDDLQREGEMPLEELLALYGNLPDNVTTTNSDDEEVTVKPSESASASQLENDKLTEQTLSFIEKIEPLPVSSNLSRLISTSEDALYEISDDEEDVEDDTPDTWRRTIQIGQDYQAIVPDSLNDRLKEIDCFLDSNSTLLWNPKHSNEKDIQNYLNIYLNRAENLNCVPKLTTKNEITSSTSNSEQRDNELALYLLLKNDYKIENALMKINLDNELIDLFTFIKPWSEEDCSLFEEGLRIHGKDFYQIQKNKLPNKTVNELVHFYYLWKKTERHDMFTSKFKFEKRRYSLNPMTTDLMDHFLDDNPPQQSSLNSTSSSLNSSHNNTLTHTKHHSSPWTLLPSHLMNHLLANTTDNTTVSTTVPSNDLTSTTSNNLHIEKQIEENSNYSNDSPTSKLIINEVISTYEEKSDELVSSSSISKSIIKEAIKSDECSISRTTNEKSLTTTTISTSEL